MVTTQTLLQEIESIAAEAGELLAGYYGELRRVHAERKGGRRRDLVSRADREAEDLVVRRIPAADDLLAEEGSGRVTGAARCWVVDPLDGTVNYLHGIPFWAVSIAVIEAGELAAAVVHAPALGETFTAVRGAGSRCNGCAVAVSRSDELADSVLATGFAYDRNRLADNNVDNFSRLVMASAGLRRLGAASLDLAYTACGRLDGFWELHLAPWDVAAGALLVREAGGRVTDFGGVEALDRLLYVRHIVASNGRIHEQLRGSLAPLRGVGT